MMLKKIRQKIVKHRTSELVETLDTDAVEEVCAKVNRNALYASSMYDNSQDVDTATTAGFKPVVLRKLPPADSSDCNKVYTDRTQLQLDGFNHVDFDEPQLCYSMTTSNSFTTFRSKSPSPQKVSNSLLTQKFEERESGYSTLDDIQAQANSDGERGNSCQMQCNSYDNLLYQVAVREARAQAKVAINMTYGDPGLCLPPADTNEAALCDPGYASLSECMEKTACLLPGSSGDSQLEMSCNDNDKSFIVTSSTSNNAKAIEAMYAKAVVNKKRVGQVKAGLEEKSPVDGESDRDLYPPLPERRYSSMEASDSGVSDDHEDDGDVTTATSEGLHTCSPLHVQIVEAATASLGASTLEPIMPEYSLRNDVNPNQQMWEATSADKNFAALSHTTASNLHGRSCVGEDDLVNTMASSEAEPTHMTWDEVIHEAKVLGIPLNKPPPQLDVEMIRVKDLAVPAKVTEKKRNSFRDKFASFFSKKHRNHVSADDVTDGLGGHGHTEYNSRCSNRRGHSDIELTSDEEWSSSRSVYHQSAFNVLSQQYGPCISHNRRDRNQLYMGEHLASGPQPRKAITPPPRYLSHALVGDSALPVLNQTSSVATSSSKKMQRTQSFSFTKSISASLRRTPSASKASLVYGCAAGHNVAGKPTSYLSPYSMGMGHYMAVGPVALTYCQQVTCESACNGYRSTGEGYRSAGEGYRSAGEGYRSAGEGYRSAGEGYRSGGEGYRSAGEGYRIGSEGYRSAGEGYRNAMEVGRFHHHQQRGRLLSADTVLERVKVPCSAASRADRPLSDSLTRTEMMADGRRQALAGETTPGSDLYRCNDGGSNSSVTSNQSTTAAANALASLALLKDMGWYWGPLSWEEAEAKLDNKPDGAFLVRDSSDDRYILSLTFRSHGTTHHTRIEHYKGVFSFYSQPKSHGAATIIEFIEKAIEHSRSGRYLYFLRPRAPGLPPAPIQLLFPVSRFYQVASLQHLCRFLILKQVRRDHISLLPVPRRIVDYLEQTQYYTELAGNDSLDKDC